jgi:GH24 family phage-related lysozyme (muramidase)
MVDFASAVKKFEGFAPRASWDYKQNSNGYGTRAKFAGEEITREEAERRFSDEYAKAANYVNSFAPDAPEGVKGALTSLTYNAGPGWQNSGLGQMIKAGDYAGAKERFLQYNKAGGQEHPGLVSRRQQEIGWGWDGQPSTDPSKGALNMAQPAGMQAMAQAQPALSPNAMFGPGALSGGGEGGFDFGGLGTGLQGAGAYLMGISDPKALGALAAINQNKGSRFTTQYDPNTGRIMTVDSRTGRATFSQDPSFDPKRKSNEAYDASEAQSNQKLSETIFNDSQSAQSQIGTIKRARELFANPNVPVGTGADYVQAVKGLGKSLGIDLEGVAEGQELQQIAAQLTLQSRSENGGMPGALSNSDLDFLKKMTIGLSKDPIANAAILDKLEAIQQRKLDVARMRDEYVQKNGRLDEGFKRQVREFATANPIFSGVTPPTGAAQSTQGAPANTGFKVINVTKPK